MAFGSFACDIIVFLIVDFSFRCLGNLFGGMVAFCIQAGVAVCRVAVGRVAVGSSHGLRIVIYFSS